MSSSCAISIAYAIGLSPTRWPGVPHAPYAPSLTLAPLPREGTAGSSWQPDDSGSNRRRHVKGTSGDVTGR